MRVIVGGIGYRNLRDHSAGVEVIDRLARQTWRAGVVVEDLSYNPIAVVQRLEDETPDRAFERAVLVAAVPRGRPPGAVTVYRWDGRLPDEDEIQRAITDAVTGVISLDNTVVVVGHFGAWPSGVVLVEVEPLDHEFGERFSAPVAAALDEICTVVTRLAMDESAAAALPCVGLGGRDLAPDTAHALETGPGHSGQSADPDVEPEVDVLRETERLIAALDAHPDATVRGQLQALLAHIDTVHRTALTRLVAAIHAMAGEAFVNRLAADPAIRLLLMSYDLLAVDRRLVAEEALDAVRSHLHAHGVDVELTAVSGGAVSVKLHGIDRAAIPLDAVRRDVEAALAHGLPGFQELTLGDRTPPAATPLLQIGSGRLREPVYRAVCATADVPAGSTRAVDIDGERVLVVNVGDGEIHAVADRCGETPLPLRFGSVEGAELRCSWHGCRYDVRSGARLDRPGGSARVYPVKVEGGEVHVAVDSVPLGQR